MGRAVKASDKRKPGIVAAMKKFGGGTKVTSVEELSPGKFRGKVLRSRGNGLFETIRRVTVKEDGKGGYVEVRDE